MSKPVFVGAGVAIVTPFFEDGGINFDELKRLIEFQISEGIDSIVICGSTGEAATMTDAEVEKAIEKGKPDLNLLFIYNIPFRGMAKMMNGMVSMDMAKDILFIVNGHFFRGTGRLIHHFFHRPKLILTEEVY